MEKVSSAFLISDQPIICRSCQLKKLYVDSSREDYLQYSFDMFYKSQVEYYTVYYVLPVCEPYWLPGIFISKACATI